MNWLNYSPIVMVPGTSTVERVRSCLPLDVWPSLEKTTKFWEFRNLVEKLCNQSFERVLRRYGL